MANLEKIVKVTQEQYDILASGGTVGEYTGLDENYIYLIKEDKDWAYPAPFLFDSEGEIVPKITSDEYEILYNNDIIYVYQYDNIEDDIVRRVYIKSNDADSISGSLKFYCWWDSQYKDEIVIYNDFTIALRGVYIPIDDNLVHKSGSETLTGIKTFKNVPIRFTNSYNQEVGKIEITNTTSLKISAPHNYSSIVLDAKSAIEFDNNGQNQWVLSSFGLIPGDDNTKDIGASFRRIHNIFVAGDLSDGTNTVTVSEIQKKNIMSKTFTNVLATTDSRRFFGRILPTSYTGMCRIHYREKITVDGHPDYTGYYDCFLSISSGVVRSYYSYNDVQTLPISYHKVLLPTQTGITSGYGIPLGDEYYNNITTLARTCEIEIIEIDGGTFEFFDSMLINTDVPGYTTTNTNFTTSTGTTWAEWLSAGLVELNDRNETSYFADTYARHPAGTNGVKGIQFIMQKRDGTWESITTTTGTGTSKVLNTNGFLPDRLIWYNSGTIVNSGSYTPTWYCYYVYNVDRRYVDNAGSIQSKQYNDYYFKGHLVDGLFYFDTNQWWAFELPTTEDGFVYMLVGNLGNNTTGNHLAISKDHPMYKYDASIGGVVEVYAGQSQVKRYI